MLSGTEDEDLFNPNSHRNSNLATLFGTSINTFEELTHNLTYAAPRQPKLGETKGDVVKTKSEQSMVICAKPVMLFKQEDKKYVPLGKYGMALVGAENSKLYEIILYKDKQNIVCRAKVCTGFNYKVQNDNFASFFDDKKQNWLLHFENETDFTEIRDEIDKLGAKIVDKIKSSPKPQNEPPTDVSAANDTMSVEESELSAKYDVLTRMAKLGQPVVPVQVLKASKTDASESESDTEKTETRPVRKPRRNLTERQAGLGKPTEEPNDSLTMFPSSGGSLPPFAVTPSRQQYAIVNHQMVPMQSTIFPQIQNVPNQVFMTQPNLPSDTMMSENRAHNSEVRLHLNHLSNKLDEILWKVSSSNTAVQSTDEKHLISKVKALELKAANLEKEMLDKTNDCACLKRENLALKEGCKINDENLQSEIDNLRELLQIQENVVDDLKKKLTHKESTLLETQTQLSSVNSVRNYLETLILNLQKSDDSQLMDYETFQETMKDTFHGIEQAELTAIVSDVIEKLCTLERYYNENQQKGAEFHVKALSYRAKVEQVMMDLYHHTVKHLAMAGDNLPSDFTKKVFPRNVKTATNYILREFQRDFNLGNVWDDDVVSEDSRNSCEVQDSVTDLSD